MLHLGRRQDSSGGLTLGSRPEYGYRVKGHTIDLNLIRSVPHPGDALITKDSKSGDASQSVYGDLATHRFRYALLPHQGPGDAAVLTQAAREFNTPLSIHASSVAAASLPVPFSPFQISAAAIELAAIKATEDGKGWALRLVNVTENPVTTELHLEDTGGTLIECDLLENATGSSFATVEAGVPLAFRPFEIKTLRWMAPPLLPGKPSASHG